MLLGSMTVLAAIFAVLTCALGHFSGAAIVFGTLGCFVGYWLGLFAMVGAILQNVAFAMKKPKVVRILTAICIPFWFTYNFSSQSYASMTSDCLTFISVMTGIVRFDILKRPEKPNNQKEGIEA